ncbi:MAG: hypothetical protein J07HQW1_01473 [Haloquadratum walsbyi J07HQW1]|uniref:Uncharacterized protein n=1 Tax=Haloquadratum walsbyi J07HQW1 TaxID=1238424 RepID=U1MNL6_9EURY|nr:MAG: hypothetical protein J07HQW1_01473 [Haloquadratum walsbyi J07HQW1]
MEMEVETMEAGIVGMETETMEMGIVGMETETMETTERETGTGTVRTRVHSLSLLISFSDKYSDNRTPSSSEE